MEPGEASASHAQNGDSETATVELEEHGTWLKLEFEPELTEEQLNESFERLCQSKAEEFWLIGYEHVTGADVWNCVSYSYVKKGVPPLHRIVNDILSLKVTSFMNWLTMSIYREDARF